MFTTTLNNQLSEITKLHEMLEKFGQEHHVPEHVVLSMNFALEEIITNIISYGYQDSQEHGIDLRLSVGNGSLIAEVEDDATPFNLLEAKDPDLSLPMEDRPIGGLGIHLTKKMMDELYYEHRNGKNVLRLSKKLSTEN